MLNKKGKKTGETEQDLFNLAQKAQVLLEAKTRIFKKKLQNEQQQSC